MKITKTDRIILERLRELGTDTCYNLSRDLDKDVAHIYRRLERMVIHKVVIKGGGYPKFYEINKGEEKELVMKMVKCPQCNETRCVDFYQMIKTCVCGKKFRIYKKHIVEIICI